MTVCIPHEPLYAAVIESLALAGVTKTSQLRDFLNLIGCYPDEIPALQQEIEQGQFSTVFHRTTKLSRITEKIGAMVGLKPVNGFDFSKLPVSLNNFVDIPPWLKLQLYKNNIKTHPDLVSFFRSNGCEGFDALKYAATIRHGQLEIETSQGKVETRAWHMLRKAYGLNAPIVPKEILRRSGPETNIPEIPIAPPPSIPAPVEKQNSHCAAEIAEDVLSLDIEKPEQILADKDYLSNEARLGKRLIEERIALLETTCQHPMALAFFQKVCALGIVKARFVNAARTSFCRERLSVMADLCGLQRTILLDGRKDLIAQQSYIGETLPKMFLDLYPQSTLWQKLHSKIEKNADRNDKDGVWLVAYANLKKVENEIVLANQPLAKYYAAHYARDMDDDRLEDYSAYANIGLIRAVRRWDPRCQTFGYVSDSFIRKEIRRAISCNGYYHGVTVPNSSKFIAIGRYQNALKALQARDGIQKPTIEQIAEKMGSAYSLKEVRRISHYHLDKTSLDCKIGSKGNDSKDGLTLKDRLVSSYKEPDKAYRTKAALQELGTVLSWLSPDEEKVIRLMYGIGCCDEEEIDGRKISSIMNMTYWRLRETKASALEQLRYPVFQRFLRSIRTELSY